MADSDFMRGPIILDDQWMVHGDIRRALFEITHGITACGHYVAEQLIGLCDRFFWVIHELGLDRAPGRDIALTVACRERTDGKSFNTFFSLFEPGFGLAPASAFLDGTRIFGSEPSLQSLGFALPEKHRRSNTHNSDKNHADDNDQGHCAHFEFSLFFSRMSY